MTAVEYATRTFVNNDALFVSLKCKDAKDPLDLSALINSVSGWFFRTIMFQASYIRDDTRPNSGLGSPRPITANDERIQQLAGQGSKLLVIDQVWSLRAALDKVREVITQINEVEN